MNKEKAREIIESLYEGYRYGKSDSDKAIRDMFANRLIGAKEMYEAVFAEAVILGGDIVKYANK